MLRRNRALAALIALALALPASAAPRMPGFARAASTAPARLAPGEWPQAKSDVAPDPQVRFGALPNGMRYAIMKNATPPQQASLRLRFDAGSLMETDAQQGLAHFLEHMAFNGSKNVPEGEMIKTLERLGLSFGADTNASTDFQQTIYKLDLPHTNDETVDASLMLLREAAGNLTLDPGAIDRERGVVLAEERARDTPPYRSLKDRFAFVMKGQLPPKRMPIGQVEVLRTAKADEFRKFYSAYYRPERAVLVAVGDFDVAAMEAKIKARFSDWKAEGPAGPEPDLGALAPRKQESRIFVDPGMQNAVQIIWTGPADLAADTTAKRKRDLAELLGFAVLNRRLARLVRSETPPFIAAGAFRANQQDALEATTLYVTNDRGRWKEALEAALLEQRRAARFGVRQDELDREISEFRAALTAAAAGAATRRTPSLANAMIDTVEDAEVITSPAQDLELFEAAVKDLKAETVSKALKDAFEGHGPLIFLTAQQEIAGGEAAVTAAYEAAQKAEVTAPAAAGATDWPYASFGTPSKVVEEKDVADLDTTFVRFANGVRLTVKPTKFRDDQILVNVRVGRGLLDLPPNRQSLSWAGGAITEGGLKQISADDLEQVLAGKVYGANFGVDDEAFVFAGATRPEDLDTQMQVLAAYVAEPGWRPEAFARIQTYGATIHQQYEATDSGVVGRDLGGLLRKGDRRWTFPSREEIAGAKLADLRAEIDPAFTAGPIEVVIVGDITVEKATDAVARTFGALPPRPEPPALPEAARRVGFPDGGGPIVERTHKGRADQATAYVAWKTDDFFSDPQEARAIGVLGEIMRLRLLEELREAQGVTYSPSVGNSQSLIWSDWGYISASVRAPPDKLDGFFADVFKMAASLRDKPVDADELQRAKAPRLERLIKARETNEYWLSQLSGAQGDPRRLDAIRSVVPSTERVTAAEVQAVARKYLNDANAWRFVVKAEGK